MYMIGTVIYGVPITQKISDVFDEEGESYFPEGSEDFPCGLGEHDGGWFTTLYSGCSPHTVGYLGHYIAEFKVIHKPLGLKQLNGFMNLSDEKKEEVRKLIDEKLPDFIKDVMPEIDFYVVWSTS